MLEVRFKSEHPLFELPNLETKEAACFDLKYCGDENIVIAPGDRSLVPLGFSMEFNKGWELQIRPRSGLAIKHGVTILNSPGTVDADYRGHVSAVLINTDRNHEFTITPGMRVCQACFKQVHETDFEMVKELGNTDRGHGGFGSTGTH